MIEKGNLIEVEDIKNTRNGIHVFFRGICMENCSPGQCVNVKMTSGRTVSGKVYRNMNSYINVHHFFKQAKQIIQIKSF